MDVQTTALRENEGSLDSDWTRPSSCLQIVIFLRRLSRLLSETCACHSFPLASRYSVFVGMILFGREWLGGICVRVVLLRCWSRSTFADRQWCDSCKILWNGTSLIVAQWLCQNILQKLFLMKILWLDPSILDKNSSAVWEWTLLHLLKKAKSRNY